MFIVECLNCGNRFDILKEKKCPKCNWTIKKEVKDVRRIFQNRSRNYQTD